jgi:hypothetical protein
MVSAAFFGHYLHQVQGFRGRLLLIVLLWDSTYSAMGKARETAGNQQAALLF